MIFWGWYVPACTASYFRNIFKPDGVKAVKPMFMFEAETPKWSNSRSVCALADGERHFGHILRIGGRWHAFDATRPNDDATGFLFLGCFGTLAAAKASVEQSTLAIQSELAKVA
jgi:hypothetical protein